MFRTNIIVMWSSPASTTSSKFKKSPRKQKKKKSHHHHEKHLHRPQRNQIKNDNIDNLLVQLSMSISMGCVWRMFFLSLSFLSTQHKVRCYHKKNFHTIQWHTRNCFLTYSNLPIDNRAKKKKLSIKFTFRFIIVVLLLFFH